MLPMLCRACMTETQIDLLEPTCAQVDVKWMAVKGWVQVRHGLAVAGRLTAWAQVLALWCCRLGLLFKRHAERAGQVHAMQCIPLARQAPPGAAGCSRLGDRVWRPAAHQGMCLLHGILHVHTGAWIQWIDVIFAVIERILHRFSTAQ